MPQYAQAPTGLQVSADVEAVIPVVLSRAREVVERKTLLTSSPLVTKLSLGKGQGRKINLPRFTQRFTAANAYEAVPIDNFQKLVPDMQSFTTYEIALGTIITDQAEWFTPEPLLARSGRLMGAAIKRRQEEDMISLFNGASRTIGAPGASFQASWLLAAAHRLEVNLEIFPYDPSELSMAVVHPFQLYPIYNQSGTIGSTSFATGFAPIPGWTEDLIRNYQINRIYGVPVARHTMIPRDALDDSVGAFLGRDALGFISTPRSYFVERDRDIRLRASIIVASSHYGVAFLDDQHIIRFVSDASTPTG